MKDKDHEKLIAFARLVLARLEADTDWNSETTDAIGQAALDSGLARLNKQGYFRRK